MFSEQTKTRRGRHFGEAEVFIVQVVNEQNATLVLSLLILGDEKYMMWD